MSSLKTDFNDLIERLRNGRDFAHASYEPVFYLVFHPSQILEVKRNMPAWEAKLTNEGWTIHKISLANEINSLIENAPLYQRFWLTQDATYPLQWEKTNKTLSTYLSNGRLVKIFQDKLTQLNNDTRAILLVTDLEALHPYLRIGTIEGQLQGQFSTPTIFFYPGTRTGKTRLKFLGFYPEDGNYRSVHIGG